MSPNPNPTYIGRLQKWALFTAGLFGSLPVVFAQSTTETPVDSEDVIELSPFTVDATDDNGYYASQTLAGGRVATDLKDTGTSVEVLTKDLLDDIAANNVEEFLQYTTGGEVGGSAGNFVGASTAGQFGVADSSAARREPHTNTRLRGIGSPDYVRNYYKTNIPMDAYNTERVDVNRGANSFLFGLGSPAGLINSSYAQAQMNKFTEVVVQIGSGGDRPSYRFSFDTNQEIIEDKLAVRFAALQDRKQYRQEPSFRDDDRYYAAVKFKPFKGTTIRAHIEDGNVNGNAPDTLLPAQAFDTFIEQRTPVDIFYNVQNFGNPEGPSRAEWEQMSPEDQERFIYQGRGGNLLLAGGDMWGYAFVYDGTNNGDPAFGFQPWVADNKWEPTDPYWSPNGRNGGPGAMMFWKNNRYRGEIGGIGPAQGFTSLDGFDFSKQNFGGDSDFFSHNFDTYNVTLEQLLFDDQLGIEIGFDTESKVNDALTNFNGWKGEFLIDINQTLPLPVLNPDGSFKTDENGEVVSEARINPNYGRPFYNTEPARSTSFEDRETFRATMFGRYDFEEKHGDSWLKWLGNHTLTGLYDDFREEYRTADTRHQTFSDSFNLGWHVGNSEADRPASGYRRLSKMVYFGPALQSYITDPFNPATPININDIVIQPPSANLLDNNPRGELTYWSLGPDAEGSNWTHVNNPDEINNHRGVNGTNLFQNEPDTYIGNRREFWARAPMEGIWEPIDNIARITEVESWAVNLQSMFFKNHLVLNGGYREDVVKNWLNPIAPEKHDLALEGTLPDSFLGNRGLEISPEYFKAEDGIYSEIDKGPTGEGSFGYGGVLHLPRNLRFAKMPEGIDVSLHYNYSKNFVPDASRNTFQPAVDGQDWYFGTLDSPIGEGEDMGFTVSLNNNKLVARFNWFESSIQNNSSGLGSTLNQLVFWGIRGRGWADQDMRDMDPDGNGVIDVRADGSPHPRANNPRWDLSRVQDVLDATQWAVDEGWIEAKQELGILEFNPNGSQRRQQWFPGLEDTEDKVSKGFELNLTYNPTNNWRIAFNATNIESVSSNVGPLTSHLMDNFFDSYNTIKGYVLWEAADTNPTNAPFSRWFNPHVLTYYQKKLQEGSSTNEVRDWYANVVTNYQFREGRLKGFSVGGAVRYQSSGAIGYPLIDYEVSPGTVLSVPDVNNPWMGSDNWYVDVNVGYKRRIWNDRIDWTCRLHVKNINNYNSDGLTTYRANFDGSAATVRWDPPLELILSNSFRF